MTQINEHVRLLKLEEHKDLFSSYINESYIKNDMKVMVFSSFYYNFHDLVYNISYHIKKEYNKLYIYNNGILPLINTLRDTDKYNNYHLKIVQKWTIDLFKKLACCYDLYNNHDEFIFYAVKAPMGLDINFILSKDKDTDKLVDSSPMFDSVIRHIGNISHILLDKNRELEEKLKENKEYVGDYVFNTLMKPSYLCNESAPMIYIVRGFENIWFITPKIYENNNKQIYPKDIFEPINYDKYLVVDGETLEVIDATI